VTEVAETSGSLDQPGLTGELYAIDADGKNKSYLFGYRPSGIGIRANNATMGWAYMLDTRILSPKAMLIGVEHFQDTGEHGSREIRRLDVRNGTSQFEMFVPLQHPFSVAFGPDALPVMSEGPDEKGDQHVMWLDTSGNEKTWKDALPPEPNVRHAAMLEVQADNPKLVSYLSDEGSDRVCLRRFDLGTMASTLLSCDERVSVGDVFISPSTQKPVAVRYEDGYPRTVIVDPDSPDARIVQMLERTFEHQRVTITSTTADGNRMIVLVDSDRNPGDFYIFDRTTKKADFLMSRREWIDPEQMRPMEAIRYKTRDGAVVDGYLTRPAGDPKAAMPLVLMPHGGPHGVRDDWEWHPWVQWLASRGYAVLQVNFRGSGGYGVAHQKAGYRKWGTLMQDDLTDAVRWAIESKVTDANHVCIVGGSYGGYSALMSPVREPDLYRCAVALAGVYDLPSQIAETDGAFRVSGRRYLDEVLGSDTEELKRMSPIGGIDRLKIPVLIAHGTDDHRVPFNQAKQLRAAMDKAGKTYEWHEYAGEEHGFYKESNHADVLRVMAAFLDKNIGPAAPAPLNAASAPAAAAN
jgi:dipeptidyl aminopeptidase/acylaminoacyl peptidase